MFDDLRYFVTIAELGSYRRAASALHRTQPALTASVARLEATMGARLLDRGRHGAVPTAAGEVLLTHARAALAAVDAGQRAVAEVAGLHDGEVRLAAGATACTYLLPPILARYREAHPGIRFLLRETTTDEALDGLHAGDIDLAVITSAPGEPWFEDELIVVRSPDFRPDRDAGKSRFVTFRKGSTSRALLEQLCPQADIVMELGSIAAVKGNVRAGIGLALVSRHAVASDLDSGALVRVRMRETPVPRPLALVHAGADRLPPAAAALRKMLLAPGGRPRKRSRASRPSAPK